MHNLQLIPLASSLADVKDAIQHVRRGELLLPSSRRYSSCALVTRHGMHYRIAKPNGKHGELPPLMRCKMWHKGAIAFRIFRFYLRWSLSSATKNGWI